METPSLNTTVLSTFTPRHNTASRAERRDSVVSVTEPYAHNDGVVIVPESCATALSNSEKRQIMMGGRKTQSV